MRLTHIQEARYHADHPIVVWIKKFIKGCEVSDRRSYRLISEKHGKDAERAITAEFGDKMSIREWPVPEWSVGIIDKYVHIQIDYKNLEVEVSCFKDQ